MKPALLAAIITSILLLAACDNDSTTVSTIEVVPPPITQSKLFTSTNDPSGNVIVALNIADDGSLEQAETYSTGGIGDADDGDFDGQSSIRIVNDNSYLLVVNAGDHPPIMNGVGAGSISVFSIDDEGLLTLVDQTPADTNTVAINSGGVRPVSIDYFTSGDTTFVLVANQYSNPLCDSDGVINGQTLLPVSLGTCFDQNNGQLGTGADGSTGTLVFTSERNISVFTLSADGILTALGASSTVTYESPAYGGPSQVSFSPDGSMAAVTTWGVPNFRAAATTTFQAPSRTYLYDVSIEGTSLSLTNERFYQQSGVSGSIGFSWTSNNDTIYVANFNIAENVPGYSVTALNTSNTTTVFTSDNLSMASGNASVPGSGVEACWTWLSADNSLLLVPSFTANTVSSFLTQGDAITHRETLVRRLPAEFTGFPADTKDVFVTGNGLYAYVMGALTTHTVSIYDLDTSNNVLIEQLDSPYEIPFSRPNGNNVSDRTHAYLGLAGWPADFVGY